MYLFIIVYFVYQKYANAYLAKICVKKLSKLKCQMLFPCFEKLAKFISIEKFANALTRHHYELLYYNINQVNVLMILLKLMILMVKQNLFFHLVMSNYSIAKA